MVLRFNTARWLLLALPLVGCVQPREDGLYFLPDAGGQPPPVPDAAVEGSPPDAPVSPRDSAPPDASPPDAPPPPDAMVMECTPNAVGCTADNRQVRTCNGQGRWVPGQTCAATDVCSVGACVCNPPNCEDGTIKKIEMDLSSLPGDMAAGSRALFLSFDGAVSRILRFDLQSPQNTVQRTVHDGTADDAASYALDADAMDNLVWCSLATQGSLKSGEIVYGANAPLDTGPCTDVQRRDNFIYYKTGSLHRRALGSDERETLSNQAMEKFVVTADAIYFVGTAGAAGGEENVLGRLSLTDLNKVDIFVHHAEDDLFRGLLTDGTHVYAWSYDEVLRVPLGGGPSESLWRDQGTDLWSLTQSESHLYWSVNVPGNGCIEAQIWRRPKAGGEAKIIASLGGYCAGPLVRLGDRIYAVTWAPPGGELTLLRRLRL
jgi:hypothetical protein